MITEKWKIKTFDSQEHSIQWNEIDSKLDDHKLKIGNKIKWSKINSILGTKFKIKHNDIKVVETNAGCIGRCYVK